MNSPPLHPSFPVHLLPLDWPRHFHDKRILSAGGKSRTLARLCWQQQEAARAVRSHQRPGVRQCWAQTAPCGTLHPPRDSYQTLLWAALPPRTHSKPCFFLGVHNKILTDTEVPALLNRTKGYLTSFRFNGGCKVPDLPSHDEDSALVLRPRVGYFSFLADFESAADLTSKPNNPGPAVCSGWKYCSYISSCRHCIKTECIVMKRNINTRAKSVLAYKPLGTNLLQSKEF